MQQVLSREREQCLEDQLAAVQASRRVLSQENSLLQEQVYYLLIDKQHTHQHVQVEANEKSIDCLNKEVETGKVG